MMSSANEAIRQYAHLVKAEARRMLRFLPASIERDDLEQVGMIGLLEAGERYSAEGGAAFATFAALRIRGAMLDELRRGDRLSRNDRRDARRLDSISRRLHAELGRAPLDAEAAAALGMPLAAVQQLRARVLQASSAPPADEDGEQPQAPDSKPGPATTFGAAQRRAALAAAIQALPPRERAVIEAVYRDGISAREVAARVGVTESRISQLLAQTIARLRVRMQEHAR